MRAKCVLFGFECHSEDDVVAKSSVVDFRRNGTLNSSQFKYTKNNHIYIFSFFVTLMVVFFCERVFDYEIWFFFFVSPMRFALIVFLLRLANVGYGIRHNVYGGMQIGKIRIGEIRLLHPKNRYETRPHSHTHHINRSNQQQHKKWTLNVKRVAVFLVSVFAFNHSG